MFESLINFKNLCFLYIGDDPIEVKYTEILWYGKDEIFPPEEEDILLKALIVGINHGFKVDFNKILINMPFVYIDVREK